MSLALQESRKKQHDHRNGSAKGASSILATWHKTFNSQAEWDDKDEFLDVIYWIRQVLGIILGVLWGIVPLKGFFGIALFCAVNVVVLYVYFTFLHKVDEEEYGGVWELTKEGFVTSFAGFLVTWIIIYSGLYHQ